MSVAALKKSKPGKAVPAVPTVPPVPRAPAVLAYLEAAKPALAALHEKVGEAALEAALGEEGGSERLRQIYWKIRALQFEIEANDQAHAIAVRRDAEAYAEWKAAVHALPPEELIAGITPRDCASRCNAEHGCSISGFQCCHPGKAGGLPPALRSDPVIRKVYAAARESVTRQIREESDR